MDLVDTSVWIRSLYGKVPYAMEVDKLVARDEVAGHDLVYGELLTGDPGGRSKLLREYERYHQAPTVPHKEVVAFVRPHRFHGQGAGWIDLHILASAVVERILLWTADPRFCRSC